MYFLFEEMATGGHQWSGKVHVLIDKLGKFAWLYNCLRVNTPEGSPEPLAEAKIEGAEVKRVQH